MEPNATIVPTIHIIPLKDKEEYQCHILEISLHKKGIKTNIQLPNQKDVKHSNNNLELFLGTWKPFKLFAQKYDKYGIHIGFSGQKAWVYCDSSEQLYPNERKSFQKDFVDTIEYINNQFNMNLNKEQEQNSGAEHFGDVLINALAFANPITHAWNAFISLLGIDYADQEDVKKSFIERFKDNSSEYFGTRTISRGARYLFGNLLFVRYYLDDYLKENSIVAKQEE